MRKITLIALAAAALTGCGGSSAGSAQRAQIVDRCIAGGSDRAACTCTVDRATAAGLGLQAIGAQVGQGLAADRRLVAAALACSGR